MSLQKWNDMYSIRPFGFANTGVICYFNAMLQSFLSCTSVVETIRNMPRVDRENNPLVNLIGQLIDSALNTRDDVAHFSPRIFAELMQQLRVQKKQYGRFGSGQEDSGEGFTIFLDALRLPVIERLFEHRYRHHITCGLCNYTHQIEADESIFIEITEQQSHNIERAIWNFDSAIDDNYKCTKCGCKGAKTKHTSMTMVPEILVLLFIKFEKKWLLDAPRELHVPSRSGPMFNYKLTSLVEHDGTATSGHYWAKCRRAGSRFAVLNDTSVTPLGALESSPKTYMAWYHIF